MEMLPPAEIRLWIVARPRPDALLAVGQKWRFGRARDEGTYPPETTNVLPLIFMLTAHEGYC